MLKTRVLTALVLLPIVLAALFWAPPMGWAVFVLGALTVGAWEWTRLAGFARGEMWMFLIGFLGLGLAWIFLPLARIWAFPADALALGFWLLLVPMWLARKWRLANRPLAALVGWGVLLVTLMGATRLRELQEGALALLLVLGIAWVADVAAYFAGRRFGRHKLAPAISPGKTWEGVGGAVLGVTLYAGLLHGLDAPLWGRLPLFVLLPIAWLLTAVSILGDLLESLLKRQAGLKDSSQLLPGHGGVLDRIDSLLALVPVASALLFAYVILI
jgi:phosphatidate cytidylyltransferase